MNPATITCLPSRTDHGLVSSCWENLKQLGIAGIFLGAMAFPLAAAESLPGALRTIHDYRTGQPLQQAVADGTVYEFRATVPHVNFWKTPAPLDGLWIESTDKKTLLWLSSTSGTDATVAGPCVPPTGVGGGSTTNCPPANLICNGTTPYSFPDVCCGGTTITPPSGCCNNTPLVTGQVCCGGAPVPASSCCNGTLMGVCQQCVGGVIVPLPNSSWCCNGMPLLSGDVCCGGTIIHPAGPIGCCNGQPYTKATQCCSPSGTIVDKNTIANLSDCPNRVSRPPPYVPSVNGCGPGGWLGVLVPNNPGTADCDNFKKPCNAHDACYGTCNTDGTHSKPKCDDNFYNAMHAMCDTCSMADALECLGNANMYYNAVHDHGADAYNTAQKEGCICCP